MKSALSTPRNLEIHDILLVASLYLYLFHPPFFNKAYYAAIWIIFYISYFLFNTKFIYRYLWIFRVEIFFGTIFSLWALARDSFSSEIVYSDRFFIWLFQSLLLPALFLSIIEKRYCFEDWKSNRFIETIYAAVCIAGALTIALILSPKFDRFYEQIQVDGYYELYKDFEFRYRAYGIAENLNFTYGYVLGVFSGYALIKTKRSLHHIVFAIVLLIGVLYNARIGLVPILISLVITLGFGLNFRLASLLAITTIITMTFSSITQNYLGDHFSWGMSFFNEIAAFLSGSNDNTLGVLFIDMIILPDGFWNVLLGSGTSIYTSHVGNSDIGYIIQLHYAGILFLFALIVFMIFCTIRLALVDGPRNWFLYIFAVSIFFLNTKGFLFAGTPGSRLLFIVYVYFVFRSQLLPRINQTSSV